MHKWSPNSTQLAYVLLHYHTMMTHFNKNLAW